MEKQMLEDLAGLEKYEGPPKYSCKELTHPEGYPITAMRRMDTKYGASIVAEIIMPGGEAAVTFLPQRFVDNLTNSQIELFNSGNFKMKCTGMTGRSINVLFYAK